MKSQLNIETILKAGKIQNEFEFERTLIAERKLRILAKENPEYISIRKEVRDLIEKYESENWSKNAIIDDLKLKESDLAEMITEQERQFVEKRKQLIKTTLKDLKLKQQDLGEILGHKSKSYISELMNGLSPFTMKDLVIIHRVLKIELTELIPTFLNHNERVQIKEAIGRLNNSQLKLSKVDFI